MVMQRWDPFGEMVQLRRQLDRLFDDTVGGWEGRRGQQTNSFPIDIYDRGEDVQVRASLPGVKPEDVKISVQNNTVTIEGESREETTNAQSSYQEHRYGRMFRSFTLPASVDAGKATANFEHGVLTLTLPRAESARTRQIPITTNQTSKDQQAIPAQASAKSETPTSPEAQPDGKQPVASGASGNSGNSGKK